MADSGAPAFIFVADGTTSIKPTVITSLQATSTNNAFKRNALSKVADLAALAATAAVTGDTYKVTEGGAIFTYDGTKFVQTTTAVFASTSARDTAYAKASAAYRVLDAMARVSGLTYRYNGTAWVGWESDWITYTPTFTGFTIGSGGTISAQYRFRAGVCFVEGQATLGSTGLVVNFPRITHPIATNARQAVSNFVLGTISFIDIGTTAIHGYVISVSTTQADFRTQQVQGNVISNGGVIATVPFTFVAGDIISWRYEITPT